MDYGLITFRSQPCDKQLDDEFYQLITPLLNKTDRYVVSQENPGTPDAHYHIIMSFHSPKHDISKLHQKFKSKSFTNWIEKTKSTMTVISTKFTKSTSPGLEIKKINSNEEDRIKTLGYVCKENVIKTHGFTEQEITDACKYYHTCERKKPKVDNSWKVLNVKTVIPYMEMVAKQHDIPPYHNNVLYYMAKEKMYVDLTNKTKDNIRATLEIAHEEQDSFTKQVLTDQLNGSEILDIDHNQKINNLYEANRRLVQFHKYCKDKIPDFNYHDLDGY